ncbi:hypothetical protein G6O69_06195 [Pseudenhygromyxa sp. WMMC2535]|uniref:hypothetical protein n=1 Tax=Pseudenhygromyxa sp. WMMC2535 TaxID=2712867 RepID=UPI001554AB4B|nr:hypothetical protein [Pseudenhygromyxa sp. WMMC2535]NVB37414.1 hypothetical protein [Pseudenhygromyxa sp. WMMC2535]
MAAVIIPLDPERVDVDDLAPHVRELLTWFDGDVSPELAGLVRFAPAGLLEHERTALRDAPCAPTLWSIGAIVEHVLVPLAWGWLTNGAPVPDDLGAVLVDLLADPRLDADVRWEIETILVECEEAATLN